MARRRFTVGRVFVLLILGVVLGAFLFLRHRLSPESVKAQVEQALEEFLQADFTLDRVVLDLATGVRIQGLRIAYADGTTSVLAEEVTLTVDHKKLLTGDVKIRQVDVSGLIVRLRPDPVNGGVPGLPGILRPSDEPLPKEPDLPLVRIHPGRGGSLVVLERTGVLKEGTPLRLTCLQAEAEADGPRYHATARFQAERLGSLFVDLSLDLKDRTLELRTNVRELRWTREDFDLLDPAFRKKLPPFEAGGRASRLDAALTVDLDGFATEDLLRELACVADLHDLDGAFGNLHTGEAVGLPFQVEKGTATVSFGDARLSIPDFTATYISPDGAKGEIGVAVDIRFGGIGMEMDFTLRGKRLRASKEDLRHLLEPEVAHSIVDAFEPSGNFDFVVDVSRRVGLPEKVWVVLEMSHGRFNYAGQLDDLTGKRFGFRYPLDDCGGVIRVETNVATPGGLAEVITLERMRGFNRIARPRPGGADRVAVSAVGRIANYDRPDGSEPQDVLIQIEVKDLPIDGKLASAFASTPRGVPYEGFELTGWAETVNIRIEQDLGDVGEPRSTYDVVLKDCSMAYDGFPLHLHGVRGRVQSRDLPADEHGEVWRVLELIDLVGRAQDGGRVMGSGAIRQSESGQQRVQLRIDAEDLSLSEDLRAALEHSAARDTPVVQLWQRLRPQGRIHARVDIMSPGSTRIEVGLQGQAGFLGYDDIDCPVTELTGSVVYEEGNVDLSGVKGRLGGGAFLVDGTIAADGALDLTAAIQQLGLGEQVQTLLRRLIPSARPLLAYVRDGDASSIDVTVRARRRDESADLRLDAELTRIDLATAFRGVPLEVKGGPIHIKEDSLVAKNLWLRGDAGSVRLREANLPFDLDRFGWLVLDGDNIDPNQLGPLLGERVATALGDNLMVDLRGFRAEFNRSDGTIILSGALDLHRAVVPDEPADILEPTGAIGFSPLTIKLSRGDAPIRFSGVVEFRGLNMNFGVPARDLSGELRVAEGAVDADGFSVRGAVFGGALTIFDRYADELSLNIEYQPDFLRLGNIDGRFYEGAVRGNVEIHLAEPGGFRVQLRANDIDLAELLKEDLPRDEPMTGTIDAALDLRSASNEVQHMEGRGEIRVREGQLFRVPGLRSILAVLSRVTPLSTSSRFRQAEMDFGVGGEQFDVHNFHLSTATNDVYCQGNISIYGDLDLVVKPQVTRILDLPRLINIPVLSAIRNLWHKTVYEIRLEGTISSPALRLRALPFLKRTRKPFTQSPHAGRAVRIRPRLLPE